MELFQEPLGQLLSGLVVILLSVATVVAGYGIAYLKKKLKIEDGRRLQEIAADAVAEVEECARNRLKEAVAQNIDVAEKGQPPLHMMSSPEKDEMAVARILETARTEKNSLLKGLAVNAAKSIAKNAIKTALGKLKLG